MPPSANFLVSLALYGWIPVVLFLFAILPSRRALVVAFLLAWLFLPVAGIRFQGLPDYTKMSATSVGALLATVVFDFHRFLTLRFHWADLPMTIWCLVPLASSLDNGLGLYDGLASGLDCTVSWGLPYLLGRLYFRTPDDLRDLAVGVFLGGLAYAPLCLYEIRMSPQLHRVVYGFNPAPFIGTLRWGGFRPMVFMQHGLAVATWMATGTLLGAWLWSTGALRRVGPCRMGFLVPGLAATTLLCKSLGAVAELAIGLTVMLATRRLRSTVLIVALALLPPAYVLGRIVGHWSAAPLVSAAGIIDEDRAESLQFRIDNENRLIGRALERPIFGWGGWGRARVWEEDWRGVLHDTSVTDSMWVIALGNTGLVGLTAITVAMLLPVGLVLFRMPSRAWWKPATAPAAALATLLILYAIDSLFNAMVNPIFLLAAGGLTSIAVQRRLTAQCDSVAAHPALCAAVSGP